MQGNGGWPSGCMVGTVYAKDLRLLAKVWSGPSGQNRIVGYMYIRNERRNILCRRTAGSYLVKPYVNNRKVEEANYR